MLKQSVGAWFGTLFCLIGAIVLFAAALGTIDYVSRLVADVLLVGYLKDSSRGTESRIYFVVVWGIIALACSCCCWASTSRSHSWPWRPPSADASGWPPSCGRSASSACSP
jgi:hypothetical protein